MKKWMILLMTLALFGICLTAAAESSPAVTDVPVAGLLLTWPEAFSEAKGTILADGGTEAVPGIYYTYWYYCAASPEDTRRLMNENSSALKSEFLFYTFSVWDNQGVDEAVQKLNEVGFTLSEKDMILLREVNDWKFFLYMAYNPAFGVGLAHEYAIEYAMLCNMKDEIASAFTCYVPFNEYGDISNHIVRFEGTDLDGNPVSSQALFEKNQVTMVNIWATWCAPCVEELKTLQSIHARNQDNGCAVVGVLVDGDIEKARRLVMENGITYPVIAVPRGFSMIFPYSVLPTTFYVDQDGTFLETKFSGTYEDMYEDILLYYRDQLRQ